MSIVKTKPRKRSAAGGAAKATPALAAGASLQRAASLSPTSASARPSGAPDAIKSRYTVQSLAVGLQVLEALVRAGGLVGVTELADALGVSKWVAFRHLQTMCEQGFAVRDSVSEKYEAGRRLSALIDTLPPRFAWIHRAREEMHRLRQEVGLTVALAGILRDQSGVTIIDVHTGNQDLQLTPKLGAVFDFHCAAHGKVALAFGKPELLARLLERTLPMRGPNTITDVNALVREVRKVKKRGWADAPEQDESNMNALTAPIFSLGGQYEGSVGIFGSIDQLPSPPPAAYVRAVTAAAERISRRLGAT
jgi:DNA-binding IclR family transcriptional regulator